MADTTSASNIVTDPHTLLGVTRTVLERLSPRPDPLGLDARQIIEQLRLLFIDSRRGLFVFGAPDESILIQSNLHARAALERALEEVFEEKIQVELVVFNESGSSLAALTDEPIEASQYFAFGEVGQPVEISPVVRAKANLGPGKLGDEEIPAKAEGEAKYLGMGSPEAPDLNKIQLGLIQSNLRSVFTSPKRIVVVPGYLLRWIPYLGPLRTSIVVACFQAFYRSRGTTARADLTFEAPGPFLAAMAGIAESSFWRHLDDPELGWFLKKVPYKPGERRWIHDNQAGLTKKLPTRFLFRSISPLTPGDAEALYAYLMDLNIQENPVGVLTELVRGEYRVEPRDVFPFPAPPLPKGWQNGDPDGCLIHNIIYSAIGIDAKAASKELAGLVDELVERLLPANDQVHISWYYLLHWLPLLGHGPGWATILLRDRCYYNRQTGELRDKVNVRGGYQELAIALGLQRTKTVREWFPAPHAQNDGVESIELSSQEALAKISHSKRSFVMEYAARFVKIIEAEVDGRRQVSAFRAQVKLFDPLTPAHEAIYNALFPLVQRYFRLPQAQRTAFLNALDEISTADEDTIKRIVQETGKAVEEIIQKYGISIQPGSSWTPEDAAIVDFLGTVERITKVESGANQWSAYDDLGANEKITSVDPGAFGSITMSGLGGFDRIATLLSGALEKIENADPGAFERIGLVFWAHMRGLKHLVLNNHLCESLKEYFQNTDLDNTENLTSTTTSEDKEDSGNEDGVVEVYPKIKNWDLNKILDNFSPHIKRDLLEKGATVEALISCLFYITSSKGDNLGLGYVVEKLKARPQVGQGGIYHRLAEDEPEEIIARLQSYLENRSFQNRDWRVAMGTPSTEKILELLEHLGLDSSKFGNRWD